MGAITNPEYRVDTEFAGPRRTLSLQRVQWYSSGQLGAATGAPQPPQDNIHTNPEYAKEQGFAGMIADGMHSTNWMSALLWDVFGYHYIETGKLRTKFVKPVWVPTPLTAKAVVTSATAADGGIRYELDIWCEDPDGVKLTVGDASVVVDPTLESRLSQRK